MKIFTYSEWIENSQNSDPDAEGLMTKLQEYLMYYGSLKDAMDAMEEFWGERKLSGVLGNPMEVELQKKAGTPDSQGKLEGGALPGEEPRNIMKILERAGYICPQGDRFELTASGMRRIGQKALAEVFAQLRKDRTGAHRSNLSGIGGERTDETRRYETGDDFQIHLQRTLFNSLYRVPSSRPVKLKIEDFEVFKTEASTRSAVVLMLDLSISMNTRHHFETAKQLALALDGIIRNQYPTDSLYLVGFSTYARQLRKEDLPTINWDKVDSFTNLQHGLSIARKLLSSEVCTNKQVIIVSDGEPTAGINEQNQLFYESPAELRILDLTLGEVERCTREGIIINTFMLEQDPGLISFVNRMAHINKGRVFFAFGDNLGQYVLMDYMASRKMLLTT